MKTIYIAFALLACFVGTAAAQDANLSGLITDPADARVPNAEVVALNENTGAKRSTKSNSEGLYAIPSLAQVLASIFR